MDAPFDPQLILQSTSKLRHLARTLVRDEHLAEDLVQGQSAGSGPSSWRIIATLAVQALANVPLVYAVVNFSPFAQYLDPAAIAGIHTGLLFAFHGAMAAVVVKGVSRMWVLTVEASPHAFFRRLRVKGDPGERRRRPRG